MNKAAWFGSPKDVLRNKLIDYKLSDGVSESHLRDIAGMMKLLRTHLGRSYIVERAVKLGVDAMKFGVDAEWELVRNQVDGDAP